MNIVREVPPAQEDNACPFSRALIEAAAANHLKKAARLLARGADVNFTLPYMSDSGQRTVSLCGIDYPPEMAVTPLSAALFCGRFETALYLIGEGADTALQYDNPDGPGGIKPLDLVLSDHVRELVADVLDYEHRMMPRDLYESERAERRAEDLYTPGQREALLAAMIDHSENPKGLLSQSTVEIAIDWGRAEIIPKLVEIGAELQNGHFFRAHRPLHRPDRSDAVAAALRAAQKNQGAAESHPQLG